MWHAVDLHIHTARSSDCSTPPDRVQRALRARGVSLGAVTDHHDVRGWREARKRPGQNLLPGVELTCPDGGSSVHVLGIFNAKDFDEDAVIDTLRLREPGLGNAKGAVPYGVAEATALIHGLGGLAIAAHATSKCGLLEEVRGHARDRVLAEASFDAVEIGAAVSPWYEARLPAALADVPVIAGSDAHFVEDRPGTSHAHGIGGRPFWAHMPVHRPGFVALRRALRGDGMAGACSPLLRWEGRRRVDALLRLDDHWVRALQHDRDAFFGRILDAVGDLLAGDGGHVLVGARKRFDGATRGADLQRTAVELVDEVAAAFHPTPVIRHVEHMGDHGPMIELVVLAAENTAGAYTRLQRPLALRRVKAERTALKQAGAFSTSGIVERLKRRTTPDGAIPLSELVRLFPQRDWFSDDPDLGPRLARAIALHLLTLDDPPRWLVHWARDLQRARLELASAYRDLVKRDVARDHRVRVREVLAEQLPDRAQRRTVEQWLEEHQAHAAAGRTVFATPAADAADARRRACAALGEDIGPVLATEGEKAAAQYTSALRGAFGAFGENVLHLGGSSTPVDFKLLADTGIKQVLLSGAGEGDITAISVPDPLERAGARELMAMWAAGETLTENSAATAVRRAIESGVHLPVIGFVAALGRDSVEALVREIEQAGVGHKQVRRSILADLRRVLDAPDEPAADTSVEAVKRLGHELDDPQPATLKAAAAAALDDPEPARTALNADPAVIAFVRRTATPDRMAQWRRPCLVLCGLLDDDRLLGWWEEESDHKVRMSLVQAIGLLDPSPETDAVLHQALESRAGVARAAARALAARGPDGYEVLSARLPVDPTTRRYVLEGVRVVAGRQPALARQLAALACEDTQASSVFAEARHIDAALHLDDARRACHPVPARAA